MIKSLVKLTLLFSIVWFLRPVFEVLLPLPTESMVDGFLNLENASDKDLFQVLRFSFWMVFVAVILKYGRPFWGFASPIYRQYSTTKLLRRIQGLTLSIGILGFLLLLSSFLVAVYPSYQTYQQTFETQKKLQLDTLRGEVVLKKNKDSMLQNRVSASYFVKKNSLKYYTVFKTTNTGGWTTQVHVWPLDKSKTIESYSLPEPSNSSYFAKKDIRQVATYRNYFNRQKKLQKVKDEYTNYQGYVDSFLLEDKVSIGLDSMVKSHVWTSLESPFELVKKEALERKPYIWGLALLLLLVHYLNKQETGQFYSKIIHFFEQGKFGLGGSSRFAGLMEEWVHRYRQKEQSLFMGKSLFNPFLNIGLKDSRHMLTIAGSRAGKGTCAIIPNLLLWEGSTIVIDPKGANAAVTAKRRRAMGQQVHIIDPFNVLPKETEKAAFNPLDWIDPKAPNVREQVNIIAEALVVPDPQQKEKHWDDGARTIIAGMIGQLISSPSYDKPTLYMLRDMISALPEEQAELWADMSLNEGAGRLAKDAGNRIIRGINTNEMASIVSNADKHTEWLSSPAIQQTLSHSTFNVADLKDTPTTVYLILPPEYLETHNRFLRLFVNYMISQMSVGGKAKVPVMLMMDEFLALGRMTEVEKAFGLMAGYNLILWPFVQDYGRLQDLYGKSVNAFVANSRAIQIFGVSDEETKEFVSKYIGDRSNKKNPNGYVQRQIVKLRNTTEVAIDVAAETDRQYILRAGKAPLFLEKVKYYDSAPIKWLSGLGRFTNGKFHGLYEKDPDYT